MGRFLPTFVRRGLLLQRAAATGYGVMKRSPSLAAGWAGCPPQSPRPSWGIGHSARGSPDAGRTVAFNAGRKPVRPAWEGLPPASESHRLTTRLYRAHEGPHVIYRDGPIWAWLKERGLLGVTCRVPLGAAMRFRFWHRGACEQRRLLVCGVLARSRRTGVRTDQSFRDWATKLVGDDAAEMGAAASGVGVFHPDPGSLSAAFVAERLSRVFSIPPAASYRQGSWGAMFEEIARYARKLGVIIELGSRVSSIGSGITIVATEMESARSLLGDDSLDWPSGRTSLLDLGVRRDPRDLFVVSDLDTCGWLENFTMPDSTIAPAGEHLIQMQMPIDPESRRLMASRDSRRLRTRRFRAGEDVRRIGWSLWPMPVPGPWTIPAHRGGTGQRSIGETASISLAIVSPHRAAE